MQSFAVQRKKLAFSSPRLFIVCRSIDTRLAQCYSIQLGRTSLMTTPEGWHLFTRTL